MLKIVYVMLLYFPIMAYGADQAIEARIKPVGHVNIGEQVADAPAIAAAPNNATEQLYKQKCGLCHDAGLAGAPKLGSKTDWDPRMKKGMDGLLKSAINGLNAMPPKGTCVECTDEQLQATIKYMLPKN